jgi:chromosomal replication initiation ATPase DnaA
VGTAKKPVDIDRLRGRLVEMGLYEVVHATCLAHNVRTTALLRGDRFRSTARARRHVCWIFRTERKMSYPEIGRALGLDHSSVMKAIQKWTSENPVAPV